MNIKSELKKMIFSPKKIMAVAAVFLCGFFLYSEDEVTTITINNARQTTYTKSEEGNDVIVLEGSVDLAVSKGDTSSQIKADKITYDRKTEMLYAESNVEITTKSSSSGGETTTASSLLMNTSTLEGIFDNGRVVQTQTDAINLPSGSTLIVFADIFGKGKSNTIAFKNSSLTFCDDENPHWHIDASRTWLLPGGEFAFFNALLYVGYVPVLYFPAFYYPKDELVFNPVFGHRTREGYFINNTIYLYGRKPLDSSSSSSDSSDSTSAESLKALYNFMKPSSLKDQKLEGLVLHNLDTDYSGNTSDYVKLMVDSYSTLGYMVGLSGNLSPAPKYISKLAFSGYVGMSNTIFTNDDGDYIPYSPTTGEIYSDTSSFMGFDLPFRYAGNLEFALSKPFTIKFSLPIYSDPYFSYDFMENRSETMDWISYFLDSTSEEDDDDITPTEISSFSWSASASVSPTIPSILKPYISSLSLSATSSVLVSSMSATFSETDSTTKETTYYYDTDTYESAWTSVTPNKKFYYPSQVIPVSASGSISGTIFQWPLSSSSSSGKSSAPKYAITLNKPEELKTEKEIAEGEKTEEEKTDSAENEKSAENQNEIAEYDFGIEEEDSEFDFIQPVLPDLSFTPESSTVADGVSYKLTYSIAPTVSTSLNYASTTLKTSDDFDWSNYRSYMYTIKAPTTLTSALSYGGSLLSLTNKLSYSPIWQKHPYIQMYDASDSTKAGGYTESAADALILADYKAETQTVSATNTFSFMPFTYTEHFADTGVSWNSTIKLFRREFIGDTDNPEWENFTVDLEDDDCITVNTLDFNLGSSELENKFKQTLTLSTVLPPQLRTYTATLKLVFPYVTGTVSCEYEETTHDDVEDSEKWQLDPLQQSLTVSLFNSKLKLTESFNYNLDDDGEQHPESLKLSATLSSLQLAYVMSYTYGYTLDSTAGWKQNSEKDFRPYSLSFSFSPSTKTYYRWFNRITVAPGLNTSIVADLLRATNSYFLFTPSLTFKINEFFNLTFSSTSKNSILYWYFNEGLYDEWGGFPGNVLYDLINSFRFDDESKRKASGFKLKSLNMTMSHELHDWSFNMTFKVEPELVTKSNVKTYDFTPYITIGVVWNPMESIKSNLVYDYDKTEEKGIWSLE